MDGNEEQGKGERTQRGWGSEKCDCSKAVAADRARIAQAIRGEFKGRERMIVDLDDLLRVVEGG